MDNTAKLWDVETGTGMLLFIICYLLLYVYQGMLLIIYIAGMNTAGTPPRVHPLSSPLSPTRARVGPDLQPVGEE